MKAILLLCVIGFIQSCIAGNTGRIYRDAPSDIEKQFTAGVEAISNVFNLVAAQFTPEKTQEYLTSFRTMTGNITNTFEETKTKLESLAKDATPQVEGQIKQMKETLDGISKRIEEAVTKDNSKVGEAIATMRKEFTDGFTKVEDVAKQLSSSPQVEEFRTKLADTVKDLNKKSQEALEAMQKTITSKN